MKIVSNSHQITSQNTTVQLGGTAFLVCKVPGVDRVGVNWVSFFLFHYSRLNSHFSEKSNDSLSRNILKIANFFISHCIDRIKYLGLDDETGTFCLQVLNYIQTMNVSIYFIRLAQIHGRYR